MDQLLADMSSELNFLLIAYKNLGNTKKVKFLNKLKNKSVLRWKMNTEEWQPRMIRKLREQAIEYQMWHEIRKR